MSRRLAITYRTYFMVSESYHITFVRHGTMSYMLFNHALNMRIVSACIPLFFIILGTLFFPASTHYWVFILILTMCTGYAHFFIGTVYQLDSIKKKPKRNTYLLLFLAISLVSFVGCRLLIESGLEILLGAFTIIYFICHVLLNEKVFLQAQLGLQISYSNILSFTALIVPPFLLALVHPSFFYDFSLRYPAIDTAQYRQIVEVFIPMNFLFIASLSVVGLFLVIVPYRLFRSYGFLPFVISSICGVLIFLAILSAAPFHFVYLLHFVLMFHFILLFFIFLQYFSTKDQAAFSRYVTLHVIAVLIIGSVVLIPIFVSNTNPWYSLYGTVFNFGNFLTISIMHVSVSFLNETWFIKFFTRS